MIKNWKLFLESQDSGDVFKNAEEMKMALKGLIRPLIVGEVLLRVSGDKANLAEAVDMILNLFKTTFTVAIEDKQDFEDEQKEFFIKIFNDAVEESRAVFINRSFMDGVDNMVDNFINTLEMMKKQREMEGEEWREEKKPDYSEMSKSEINALIDQALDERDFEKVKMLSQYIKESMNVNAQEALDEVVLNIVEVFISYCKKYI